MIITDKYRFTFSNVGDTICMSTDESVCGEWDNLVNVPLPLWEAVRLRGELDEQINEVVARQKTASSDTSSDFWPTR